MTTQSRSQREIDAEASLWFAKKRMQSAEEFDVAAFEAWLAADARHEAAYALMARAGLAARAVLSENPAYAGAIARARTRKPRRWLAAGALTAAAAAAAFFAYAPAIGPTPQASHATEVAQIDAMTLPDGSVVTLGPASHVEVAFSDRERRVILASGEAFFEVTHDPARPFYVEAGDALVRVVGTKFDVRRGGEHVRVSVAEGIVQVRAAALPLARVTAAPITLHAGNTLQVAERAPLLGVSARVEMTTPASAGAWRQGRMTYVEAPLSELVADLNRYYPPGVRLADPTLGVYRLTASFEADQIETFFLTLPDAAPLNVERDRNGAVTITRAP